MQLIFYYAIYYLYYYYYLFTEAKSEILGESEKYMTAGSSLKLVCVLRDNTEPPEFVFWYLNEKMINYDAEVFQ